MVFEKLREMISDTLGIDKEEITPEAGLKELDIDSLDVVEIIMDIEDEFRIEIPDEEVKGFTSVADFVKFIEEHK